MGDKDGSPAIKRDDVRFQGRNRFLTGLAKDYHTENRDCHANDSNQEYGTQCIRQCIFPMDASAHSTIPPTPCTVVRYVAFEAMTLIS